MHLKNWSNFKISTNFLQLTGPRQGLGYSQYFFNIFNSELSNAFKLAHKRAKMKLDPTQKLGGRKSKVNEIIKSLKSKPVLSRDWLVLCDEIEQKYPSRTVYNALKRMLNHVS